MYNNQLYIFQASVGWSLYPPVLGTRPSILACQIVPNIYLWSPGDKPVV